MTKLPELLRTRTERQLRGLSLKSDVDIVRLRELRDGAQPTMGEARKLAAALNVGMGDLISTSSPAVRDADMLFRRSVGTSGAVPVSAGLLARKVGASVEFASGNTRRNAAWWRQHFHPARDDIESAEQNARVFRRLFCSDDQLSPLISLPKLSSERMGLMIFVVNSADMDGASAYLDGIPFAFVSARFPGRMLFTLAHEIGHLVAHHTGADFAAIDEDIDDFEREHNQVDEFYANAFASALLLPSEAVALALKTVRRVAGVRGDEIGDIEINYLARIFGVSFWAAARRCEDLRLIPRGGAYALYREVADRYGSPEKRADALGLPPRPEVVFPKIPWALVDAALQKIRDGELSVGKAASALGVPIADLFLANAPTAH